MYSRFRPSARMILLVAFSAFLIWSKPISTVESQTDRWYVWMKTSPCSGRTDWVSVAKENPGFGGGGAAFVYFPGSHYWPTFALAMAEADTLRTSPQFASYCCRENSVWQNTQTGKYTVVTSKFGNAGIGWQFVKGDLCCDEAFALAGIPGSCGSTQGGASCFAKDPGMATADRNEHLNWANQQTAATLMANMRSKIDMLWACPGISDGQLQDAFADYSTLIARYEQDATCFGGDSGVTSIDRSSHLGWARMKSRAELLDNLQWKMASALMCLGRTGQLNLFADSSVTTAKASTTAGRTSGPISDPVRPPASTPPPITADTCSQADKAAWAQMSGTWSWYRMRVTLGGSCSQVTGTFKVTEWCEGIDETSNLATARVTGTFTGKVSGGQLVVNYQTPPSPHNTTGTNGTGSCSLDGNLALGCSFGCRGSMTKQ